MNETPLLWPGINDTLWMINYGGQCSVIDDENSRVRVTDIRTDAGGKRLVMLSNGAVIDPDTLLGTLPRRVVENFGAVREDQPRELWAYPEKWTSRVVESVVHDPVRCWRNKAEWEDYVRVQRAWNKLASRIVRHPPNSVDQFTLDDIAAAELALFGNIEE
jgi:hypothetical protein